MVCNVIWLLFVSIRDEDALADEIEAMKLEDSGSAPKDQSSAAPEKTDNTNVTKEENAAEENDQSESSGKKVQLFVNFKFLIPVSESFDNLFKKCEPWIVTEFVIGWFHLTFVNFVWITSHLSTF